MLIIYNVIVFISFFSHFFYFFKILLNSSLLFTFGRSALTGLCCLIWQPAIYLANLFLSLSLSLHKGTMSSRSRDRTKATERADGYLRHARRRRQREAAAAAGLHASTASDAAQRSDSCSALTNNTVVITHTHTHSPPADHPRTPLPARESRSSSPVVR